jgi:hypothetical protein
MSGGSLSVLTTNRPFFATEPLVVYAYQHCLAKPPVTSQPPGNPEKKERNAHYLRQFSSSCWRIVDIRKGDCASEELSQLPMYTGADLYYIHADPIRDIVYIPASTN